MGIIRDVFTGLWFLLKKTFVLILWIGKKIKEFVFMNIKFFETERKESLRKERIDRAFKSNNDEII